MQSRKSSRALNTVSLATLSVALVLFVPVIERLIAAIWQWYKFSGYPDPGYITLNLKPGLILSGLLAATFGAALWFNHLARHRAATLSSRLSRAAMWVAVGTLAVYWLLGVSGLNVWRA